MKQKQILLEIKMPRDIIKPIRAMESVMANIHQAAYQPPDWWEKWIEGQVQLSVSFEMVSTNGEPHFFIRIHRSYRDAVEAAVYSQYPEVEIQEAADYTKAVPQDVPNKDYDIFAADYRFLKSNPYPIKTYAQYETEREPVEEKRIDPLAGLLESMSKVKPGEHLWIQITATPLGEHTLEPFLKEGHELKDKLARRKAPVKPKPMIQEAADILIIGKMGDAPEEKEIIPPEMKLTPGEKEIISAVEEKISKPAFSCNSRFLYFGKRDTFFRTNFRLAFVYFSSFTTLNLNALQPWGRTFTKIKKSWFLPLNLIRQRRLYLRGRKLFRNYVGRFTPMFPRARQDKEEFVLNTAEMASLFHFPSRAVAPAPSVPRIEMKRREAPPGLPVE